MTVSYIKGRAGGSSYYVDHDDVNDKKSRDDYYAKDGERIGRWYSAKNSDGSRKNSLHVQHNSNFTNSELDREKYFALVDGFDPETGEAIAQNAGSSKRVAYHDFTCSAPKSVSVVWSQSDLKMQENIESIQYNSSCKMIDFLSERAVVRLGKDGVFREKATLQGVLFGHGSSREQDPQLHTHCVLFNVAEIENKTLGKSAGALETKDMMRWQGSAASLYHSNLAYELRKQGFEIVMVEKGDKGQKNLFEIHGVPDNVMKEFSKRREQIVEAVNKKKAEYGISDSAKVSSAFFQAAAYETRSDKEDIAREDIFELWRECGEELGFSENQVRELYENQSRLFMEKESVIKNAWETINELHETKSYFTEPELLTKTLVNTMGHASPEDVIDAISEIKKELYCSFDTKKNQEIFTSPKMYAIEQEMLELCQREDGLHKQDDYSLPSSLTDEQRTAAEACLTDNNSVTVVEGTAGAGKTYTMESVARAYESNGYKAIGLSSSWSAALNLKNDAKLNEGYAITGWVLKQQNKPTIDSKTLILVDEAGTVGSKQMRDVLKIAAEHNAKVVLIGDTKQQKSVSAGNSLSAISKEIGTRRLDEIRRQNDLLDRSSVTALFNGESDKAFDSYKTKEMITVCADDESLNNKLISDWFESRSKSVGDKISINRNNNVIDCEIKSIDKNNWNVVDKLGEEHKIDKSHLIIAGKNDSVAELNKLAHEKLKEAGLIGEGRLFETVNGLAEFSVGEEIQMRQNKFNQEIYNRTRGVITDIDDASITIKLHADDRIEKIKLNDPDWFDEDGKLAMQHAYATTVYSSQGLTVGHSFVKDSSNLARDSAGVAMSRHREHAQIYADVDSNKVQHIENLIRQGQDVDRDGLSSYGEKEVVQAMQGRWARENNKFSTLDFSWQTKDGVNVTQNAAKTLLELSKTEDRLHAAQSHSVQKAEGQVSSVTQTMNKTAEPGTSQAQSKAKELEAALNALQKQPKADVLGKAV